MGERTVGVRELKATLSACLRDIKSGQTLVVTERGKPICRVSPVEVPLDEKLKEGTRARLWSWNGKKWQPARPKVRARGKTTVSELLLDDRA